MNVGVYVDLANISANSGKGIRFVELHRFASRNNSEVLRLNTYVPYDEKKASVDKGYRTKALQFHEMLRDAGFKVLIKKVKWYKDEDGALHPKANADLEIAVDIVQQCRNLDKIILLTGDGDFCSVVNFVQNQGCRVEVIAFDNVSRELQNTADRFISGFLIPNLLPPLDNPKNNTQWGEFGSIVRGICHDWKSNFGFLRFIKSIDKNLSFKDTRSDDSAYESAFVGSYTMPSEYHSSLPNREMIFEFRLRESSKKDATCDFEACDVKLIGRI